MRTLATDPGTCYPDEYDWEHQFATVLNGNVGYVCLDAGKVRGLALAYKAAVDHNQSLLRERSVMMKVIKSMTDKVAKNVEVADK